MIKELLISLGTLFIIISMSPFWCKPVNTIQEKKVSILFIDDFENNYVSIEIEGVKVLDSAYFRSSDTPQLRDLYPTFIQINNGVVKRYLSLTSEGEIVANDIENHSTLELKISIDSINVETNFEKNKGNVILVSYMKGKVDLKQAQEHETGF